MGGFALFWEGAVLTSSGAPFFAVFGIPFVVIGLYFIFGRFVHKKRTKLKTAYGITGDRAIVATGSSSMRDSPVKQVPTSLKRSRDGGHVAGTFGSRGNWPGAAMYANSGMDFLNRGTGAVNFYDVAEPDRLLAAVECVRGP